MGHKVDDFSLCLTVMIITWHNTASCDVGCDTYTSISTTDIMKRKTKYAVLTGYEMPRRDFEEFVMSVPKLRDRVDTFENCVCAYYYWGDVLKARGLPTLKRMSHPV